MLFKINDAALKNVAFVNQYSLQHFEIERTFQAARSCSAKFIDKNDHVIS